MQALRRLARIRRGVADHALVAILAVSGVGLIAYAAVAQDGGDPCVGPDCLGNDPAPDPGDGGSTSNTRPCFCTATSACGLTMITCKPDEIPLCCPNLVLCVPNAISAPFPPMCF